MHELVYFDGRVCPAADSGIGAVTSAALYGRSVFTTVAVRKGEAFLWQKHLHRLRRDSAASGIDISGLSDDELESGLYSCLRANQVDAGRARITIFDESSSGIWRADISRGPRILVMTADFREMSGLKLGIAASTINTRSRLAGVKSCNYLERLLAYEEAAARGFDEAVILNELGSVASACMANLFWLHDGTMFTPALSTGCLAGTTREFLLERMDCLEVEAAIESLATAEAIFLTSAGLGVKSVSEFNGRLMPATSHPITSLIGEN